MSINTPYEGSEVYDPANISIAGLDQAEVLVGLFNAAVPRGNGFIEARVSDGLTLEEARKMLASREYFDYIKGRCVKVRIKDDVLDARLFERDNGTGVAYSVVERLKNSRN